jgi:hypothetical protein
VDEGLQRWRPRWAQLQLTCQAPIDLPTGGVTVQVPHPQQAVCCAGHTPGAPGWQGGGQRGVWAQGGHAPDASVVRSQLCKMHRLLVSQQQQQPLLQMFAASLDKAFYPDNEVACACVSVTVTCKLEQYLPLGCSASWYIQLARGVLRSMQET